MPHETIGWPSPAQTGNSHTGAAANYANKMYYVVIFGTGDCFMTMQSSARHLSQGKNDGTLILPVSIPNGVDPSTLPSMVTAIEKALVVMSSAGVLQRADRLAELATGFVEPDLELVEDRIHRMRTIQDVFTEGEWLTAEQLNALQASPPANKAHPASDWKRRGRVFSVNYRGKEYFARYQFDVLYQPLPIIKDVLAAFGEVADTWTLAAWFHFPSGWLVRRNDRGATNVAPKDSLDRRADVVKAAAKRLSAYIA